MKYRKKPVVIEARQLVGTEEDASVYFWIGSQNKSVLEDSREGVAFKTQYSQRDNLTVSIDPADGSLVIPTLEGLMRATVGDWIIRGVEGEFYPCKPDIFQQTYERVSQ